MADQYSFNNHALRRFNETLKDAIDPNGILSPGRGGIWPKAHRAKRGAAAQMKSTADPMRCLRSLLLLAIAARTARRAAIHAPWRAARSCSRASAPPATAPTAATSVVPCCPAPMRCASSTRASCPRLLEQRTDLTPAVIKAYVRTGTWSMPPFRKTELSDAQIDEISAYITATAQAAR